MVKTESIEVSDLVLLGGEAESPFFWGKKTDAKRLEGSRIGEIELQFLSSLSFNMNVPFLKRKQTQGDSFSSVHAEQRCVTKVTAIVPCKTAKHVLVRETSLLQIGSVYCSISYPQGERGPQGEKGSQGPKVT